MARKRFFTARDIDRLIPKIESVFTHIDECRAKAESVAAGAPVPDAKASPEDVEAAHRMRNQVEFLMQAVQDNIDFIASLGGITKDVESGLVDFPAQVNGEQVWLCWKRGENKVRYFHALDEGFQERQALHRAEANVTYH
jgi:hypothetical protein